MTRQAKPKLLLRTLLLTIAVMMTLPVLLAPARASLSSHTLKIGILEGTTGVIANEGIFESRGAEQAIQQANIILAAGGTGIQFTYAGQTYDTKGTPDGANQGYLYLVNTLGDQVIVGPCCSFEIKAFQSTAGTFTGGGLHVPAISPSSTAASLAIPNDYIFRAPGPDSIQAIADALWVYNRGVRFVGEIARNDNYGAGLRDGFQTAFLSICAMQSTACFVRVETYVTGFAGAASASAAALDSDVNHLLKDNATCAAPPACTAAQDAKVGVYAVAFETDGDEIYTTANSGTYAKTVKWYGSDGDLDSYFTTVPLSEQQFLASVNYTGTNPISPNAGPLAAAMANLFVNGSTVAKNGGGTIDLTTKGFMNIWGTDPTGDPYTAYAYDSAVLAMLAILKANSYSGADIAAALTPATLSNQVGLSAIGATGRLDLNANGDRSLQDYVYWRFQKNGTYPNYFFNFTTSTPGHNAQFYDSTVPAIVRALTVGPESPATIWTTTLQNLASTATFSVPVFASAWIALSSLVLAAITTVVLIRRRRL